jgi:hypothetical protein
MSMAAFQGLNSGRSLLPPIFFYYNRRYVLVLEASPCLRSHRPLGHRSKNRHRRSTELDSASHRALRRTLPLLRTLTGHQEEDELVAAMRKRAGKRWRARFGPPPRDPPELEPSAAALGRRSNPRISRQQKLEDVSPTSC